MENNKIMIPGAIIIAGIIIAGAVVYSTGRGGTGPSTEFTTTSGSQQIAYREVTEEDHIRGNPDADILVIEYSDFECPFCKNFHGTMQRVIDEYGQSGQVAWVYRHFPLVQLHSKAPQEAAASECAGELGGNDAFWAYADRIFEITPSNDGLDLALLPDIAEEIGLDRTSFNECLESGRYQAHIQEDFNDAQRAGGTGTPHSLIIAEGRDPIPVRGAQPYETVRQIIDTLLRETI